MLLQKWVCMDISKILKNNVFEALGDCKGEKRA
jgi:hypothetical protein